MTTREDQDVRYWLTDAGYAALAQSEQLHRSHPDPKDHTMTTQPSQPSAHEALLDTLQDDEAEAYTVVAEPDTRLSQLHAAYADTKATADDAAKKLKAITDAIKVELNTAAPEETRVELRGDPSSGAPALTLRYTERWTLDSKRLKHDDPETYVRYARKGGSWSLTQVRGA